MKEDKTKRPDFGRRGHIEVATATQRRPSIMERLKSLRWWVAPAQRTTPLGKGFKNVRTRP